STLYEHVTGKIPYSEVYPVEPKEILQSSDPSTMIAHVGREHLADTEVEKRYRNYAFLMYPTFSEVTLFRHIGMVLFPQRRKHCIYMCLHLRYLVRCFSCSKLCIQFTFPFEPCLGILSRAPMLDCDIG